MALNNQMNVNQIVCNFMNTAKFSSSSSSTESEMDESCSSSEDSYTSAASSSEEEADVLFFPLMQYLSYGRRRHRIENFLQVVDVWTEAEFKEHLRLTRNTALRLIEELELSNFIPKHSFGPTPIPAKLSFLVFLWYIANTEPLRTMADRFDISISSVFRVIRRVLAWLLTQLDSMIKWPQGLDIMMITENFRVKQGISNIIGAIDGTHIRIEKPAIFARDYCNRKKFFSIILQAVVDANLKFTNIYCGEPGSLHDARVFRRSLLYETASDYTRMLFPGETFIIGDSAYPSLQWLVPPYRDNGHLTPLQTEFNFMLSSTRMCVEKAFGHLKGRFRRIKFFTEYRDMSLITDTVVAACILHNYCVDEKDMYDFPEEDENNDEYFMNYENMGGEIPDDRIDRRTQLFNEIFPEE